MLSSCLPEGQWLNSPGARPDELKKQIMQIECFFFSPGIQITRRVLLFLPADVVMCAQ